MRFFFLDSGAWNQAGFGGWPASLGRGQSTAENDATDTMACQRCGREDRNDVLRQLQAWSVHYLEDCLDAWHTQYLVDWCRPLSNAKIIWALHPCSCSLSDHFSKKQFKDAKDPFHGATLAEHGAKVR